ncbi:CopY/TcrY family copper transport repressor [Companilactobacillus sp.]|jgi:CopY/TcrY family copper transport repressor|uniref:CopY/TcrY family copper transport repressor n=1 Tax=Companilactobacillus sp. TaxID=2767905 RepID=UPI0025C445CA|nr:CopY/TcrY family copper transport repressor [Companilactobacillus sp.]MCH4010048.1 CopY/TcrY family copper transport repressor [Companilactobacillus sp.]MCH4052276.1 CopY/TcrY family copper transport repressor [Companilactobacillus sp.]MCH4077990.1 CopY/TcrY family copper transport repressor [Companilactobacillus sp.]MCH4126566.1 CopY/TcrY family copper transport repressor [Companilactobacillus sp.]MCH4132152.1 CopY/TcrY family copper transport repressor [Companilactobacillus sp.]
MDNVKDINITTAEWRIMRVIWTLGTATSRELTDILGESMGWKSATIKTLLRRLLDKDAIKFEKEGNKFIYSAKLQETDTIELTTKQFFDQLCARKIGTAITSLIDESELTQDDIDSIKEALDKKSPVAEIKCNCLPDGCDC